MQKNKGNVGDEASSGLGEVKDTYKDVDDYISTFEPLLFEEVKAQITQKRDEEEGIFLSSFFFLFGSRFIFWEAL
jgi:senataxin